MTVDPHYPIDESVKLPPQVLAAQHAAEAFYKPPAGDPQAAADPQPDPALAADPQPVPVTAAVVEPQPAPVGELPPPALGNTGDADKEHQRFLAMRGRFDQATRLNGEYQEQISQLGDELHRAHSALQRPRQEQPISHNAPPAPLVTTQDRDSYGDEQIDFVQRVARSAVEPELQRLSVENQQLKKQVVRTANDKVLDAITQAVPDWRTVKSSPEFRNWLRLTDPLSGRSRFDLLAEANQAASAPRVVAVYRAFLQEEGTTGAVTDPQPQSQPKPAPVSAAVPLETFAAPGRVRPASGNAHVPADQPFFSRSQIRAFYSQDGIAAYRGDQKTRAADEQLIFAAQREGRILDK